MKDLELERVLDRISAEIKSLRDKQDTDLELIHDELSEIRNRLEKDIPTSTETKQ
jgi:hypothetical protein